MKKCFVILFVLIANSLFAQSDCVLKFIYSGNVNLENKDIVIDKIQLPAYAYFTGRKDSNNSVEIYTFENGSSNFRKMCFGSVSSNFCNLREKVIEQVFKNVKTYPIKVYEAKSDHIGEYKTFEIEIPIEKIKFTIIEDKILIEFPEIII